MALTSFRPVVTCTVLAKHEVVGAEEVTKGTAADRVHGTWLEIDKDSARDVFVGTGLIVVHTDPFELKVVRALVFTVTIDTMLIRNHLPELGTCFNKGEVLNRVKGNRVDAPIWLPH